MIKYRVAQKFLSVQLFAIKVLPAAAGGSCKTSHFRNLADLFSQLYSVEFKFESESGGTINKYTCLGTNVRARWYEYH